jgi:hypothetical protein
MSFIREPMTPARCISDPIGPAASVEWTSGAAAAIGTADISQPRISAQP